MFEAIADCTLKSVSIRISWTGAGSKAWERTLGKLALTLLPVSYSSCKVNLSPRINLLPEPEALLLPHFIREAPLLPSGEHYANNYDWANLGFLKQELFLFVQILFFVLYKLVTSFHRMPP